MPSNVVMRLSKTIFIYTSQHRLESTQAEEGRVQGVQGCILVTCTLYSVQCGTVQGHGTGSAVQGSIVTVSVRHQPAASCRHKTQLPAEHSVPPPPSQQHGAEDGGW